MGYEIRIFSSSNDLQVVCEGKVRCTVHLPSALAEYVCFENLIVIRLETDQSYQQNENVFAYSLDGKLLWQIPEVTHVYNDSPYVSIKASDNMLVARNWDGLMLSIIPASGEIIKREEGR